MISVVCLTSMCSSLFTNIFAIRSYSKMPYDDWGAWYDYDEYHDCDDDDDYERCCDICGATNDSDHSEEMHMRFDARQATLEYFVRDKRCANCGGEMGYDGWFMPDQSCTTEHGSVSCELGCSRNLVL